MTDVELRGSLHTPGVKYVWIRETSSVCPYLYNVGAVVEAVDVGFDFNGSPLHRVRLNSPVVQGTITLTYLTCRADQLEG